MTFACLLAMISARAEQNLQRTSTPTFSTKTRYPRLAGVPPLIAPGAGAPVQYYKTLTYQGERHSAVGSYAPLGYNWTPVQNRQKASGAIKYSYNAATDSIDIANDAVVQEGGVNQAAWDDNSGYGTPPVLSATIALTSSMAISTASGNPLGLPVRDATHAADDNIFTWASDHAPLFGSTPAVESQSNFQLALSDTDTPGEAEGRAKVYSNPNELNSDFQYTVRQSAANGNPWTIREVEAAFTFPCSCPGLYEMVRKFDRRVTGGNGAWTRYREDRETRQVDHGDWNGSFTIPLEEGYDVRLADVTFEQKDGSCSSGNCSGGGGVPVAGIGPSPHHGSIQWDMPLGLGADGRAAGILSLYSVHITPALYTPAALTSALSSSASGAIIRDSNNSIRQVVVPQAIVDVVTISANSYEVRVYTRSASDQPGTDGLYSHSGALTVTWRVDNPGGTNRWRMTRMIGGASQETVVDESQAGVTVFSEAGGARITQVTETTEGSDRVEDIVVKDSANHISSKKKIYYRTFNFGEEKVKEILDPDGAALTSIWTYSTTNDATHQRVISLQHPSGFVENWNYSGSYGNMLSHTYPALHATVGTSFSRAQSDLNSDSEPDTLWSEFDSAYGEAGARFRVEWGGKTTIGGIDYKLKESRKSVSFGVPWNDSGNITTKERFYAGGANEGRLAYRLNPDGTLFMARFADGASGTKIATEEQGASDAAHESVVDGSRTVRVTSARGFLVSSTTTDIATGKVIAQEIVGATDSLGRATEIVHLDGAVETRSYCVSCGAIEHTELHGESTDYEYDALKRKVSEIRRAGPTVLTQHRYEYDADSRLLKTWRVNPADNTETLVASSTYDLAGRLVSEMTLATGTTTYSYEFLDTNSIRTTTTYADGGTRVEYRDAGGQLYKLTGTTVAPIEYLWGAREWWGGGVGRLEYLRRYNDETNYVTEVSGINYAGEVADVTFADGNKVYRYFDTAGRLARVVDPDGVTTLLGYDAQGRQSITAVDLNGNNVIDYDGTDRIARTLSEVGERNGFTVQRTTTQVWQVNGYDTPTAVSVSEQGVDGLHSWQTVRGLTMSSAVVFASDGTHTVTTTAPDGTVSLQTFLSNRLQSTVVSNPTLATLGSTSSTYNALGQLTTTTDARTGTTTYAYDASDRLQTVTTPDPDLTRTGAGYDAQITAYAYDVMGRVTTVTQPDGGVVNTTYWPNGQIKRTWGSRTYPVEYTCDFQNRVKTLTTWQDFAGNSGQAVTTWNYDDNRGWLINKRYADNTGPSYTYKPSGRLQRRTWARGVTTDYSYNTAGDLVGTDYSDATPDVTVAYDRAGRPTTITDAAGARTLAYDASGQLKDEDYAGGLLATLGVHRTFNSLSRLASLSALSAGSAVNQVGYAYDAASRLGTVTVGTNTATYAYLPNSPLVQTLTIKQGGDTRLTTTKAYDKLNRLTSISSQPSVLSSPLSYTYTYNNANQRTKATREDNSRWDYTYDALGQVTSGRKLTSVGATIPAHDFAWTYDDIGNRRSASRNATSVETASTEDYTPNLLNQYTQRTLPGKFDVLAAAKADATVTYEYPAGTGTPTTLPRVGDLLYKQLTADNSAASVEALVKVTGVKNNVSPVGEDAVTEETRGVFLPKSPEAFTYDADGNLTGDGKWTYVWDGENRLQRMERQAMAPGGLTGYYYNFTAGTIWSGPADLTRVEPIDYDWGAGSPGPGIGTDMFDAIWKGQLLAPVSGDYVFETESDDGAEVWVNGVIIVNNWGGKSGTSIAQGTVHLEAGQRYEFKVYYYNIDGPAVMKLRWKKPGDTTAGIIPADYLYHPSVAVPPVKLEFAYDGQGRRISKKVSNWDGSAWTLAASALFLYDGWNLLAEFNSLSTVTPTRSHVWGLDLSGSLQGAGGVGGLLFSSTPTPNPGTYASAYDGNGNVVAYVDLATGAKAGSYEYNAFGETIIADGIDLPFRFSTKYTDSESSLLYYGLRYYSATMGRWINRDPVEEQGGINLFGMIANDSINAVDFLGLRGLKLTKTGGEESLRSGLKMLQAGCDVGCVPTVFGKKSCCTPEECKQESAAIIEALVGAWNRNYGKGPFDDDGYDPFSGVHSPTVGGYYCWDWARIFNDALTQLKPKCVSFQQGMAATPPVEVVNFGVSESDIDVHWFLIVYTCKRKTEGCRINFDDGFFDGISAVHSGRFPIDKRYKERAPEYEKAKLKYVNFIPAPSISKP